MEIFCLDKGEHLSGRLEVGKAWAFAHQPTDANYTPSPLLQFNSAGQPIQIKRLGVGQYEVVAPGLAIEGGVAHATASSAFGGNHFCVVDSWGLWSNGVKVNVNCFNPSGNRVDGMFTLLYYNEKRGATFAGAYLWANHPPNQAVYLPEPMYQWNSKGQPNQVLRAGTGHYLVSLRDMEAAGGTVLVTGYDRRAVRCKAQHLFPGTNPMVDVACVGANGELVDAKFTLSFMTDVGLGMQYPPDQFRRHHGGYVLTDQPAALSYIPPAPFQENTTGGTNTITRLGIGNYKVTLPGLKAFDSVAVATAYGDNSGYCTVESWGAIDSRNPTTANVRCFDKTGAPADSRFTLLYLTNAER